MYVFKKVFRSLIFIVWEGVHKIKKGRGLCWGSILSGFITLLPVVAIFEETVILIRSDMS